MTANGSTNTTFPLDLRLKLKVNSSTVLHSFIDTKFPEVISLQGAGRTASRTWNIPSSVAANLPIGAQRFDFILEDLSGNFIRSESFLLNVNNYHWGKIALDRSPSINLKVEYSEDPLHRSLGRVIYRISSSAPTQVRLKSGMEQDYGRLNTTVSIPRANTTYTTSWTIPDFPPSFYQWWGNGTRHVQYELMNLKTEVLTTNNALLKEESLPVELQAPNLGYTPSPSLVLSPAPILKDNNNQDLPVRITQLPLTKEAYRFVKAVDGWTDTTSQLYVYEITADRPFSIGGSLESWGPGNTEARTRLINWMNSTMFKNYQFSRPITNDPDSSLVSTIFGERWEPHYLNGVTKFRDFILSYNKGKNHVPIDRAISSVWTSSQRENHHPFTAGRNLYIMTQDEPGLNTPSKSAKIYILDVLWNE
jgi:hypothetical protein